MTRIELECDRCKAKIVTRSIDEASAWNKSHTEVCIGPRRSPKAPPITPDPLGSMEVRG